VSVCVYLCLCVFEYNWGRDRVVLELEAAFPTDPI